MNEPDISLEVVSTVTELIASCENNIKILSKISESEDAAFDLACIKNRLDSLIPILESTEKVIRMEYLPMLVSNSAEVHSNIKKILPRLEATVLQLWNIINFKQRESEDCEMMSGKTSWKADFKILMDLNYFVSLLLSLFALLDLNNSKSKIRCLKCLLKSYYECIDENELKVGKQIKDYVEKFCTYLEKFKISDKEDIKIYETLKLEFLILDMQASLLSNNISMAKFYEGKANIVDNCMMMKPENVFNICRTLYNDGLKLYKEEKFLDAHYFLQRCYLILEKVDFKNSKMSAEHKIRISTLIMLAKCCIKLNNETSFTDANKLLKLLQANETERVESFKLQVELIDHQKLNNNEAEELIMKGVITFPSDVEILKQVMLVLNAYSHKNATTSKNCLLYVYNNKIIFQNREFMELAESYLISLIWMVTSQLKKEISVEKLKITKNILEISDKKMVYELTNETSNCLIIMLWSMGKKRMKDNNFAEALEWFECCFVRILKGNKGPQNYETVGKIQRTMLQCCLKLENFKLFDKILNEMDEADRKNSLTLYYEYVKLLQTDELVNNKQVVSILTELSQFNDSKTINLLALCVVESKSYIDRNNNRNIDTSLVSEPLNHSINKLLNKCSISGTLNCDPLLLVALRSSVYIYGKDFERSLVNDGRKEKSIESVEMIEKSIQQFLQYSKENKKGVDSNELLNDIEWFACNCYNYGLMLLERNLLDIRGFKLFNNVLKLIDYVNTRDATLKLKYFKWECKATVFQSFCQREIIHNEKENGSEKWKEIYDQNCGTIEQIKELGKGKEYKDIKFQSVLLMDESLIYRKDWRSLIKHIKDLNEYSKEFNDDNQEIDILVQNLFGLNEKDETPTGAYDEILKILDIVIFERGASKKYDVDIKIFFKWIHIILTNMIEFSNHEEQLISYVRIFKSVLEENINNCDVEGGEREIKDFEIEWLAGVCWNKGVEIILQSSRDGNDHVEDEDTSMEESSFSVEETSSKVEQLGKKLVNDKMRWCELAISISGISSTHVQHSGLLKMFEKLGNM